MMRIVASRRIVISPGEDTCNQPWLQDCSYVTSATSVTSVMYVITYVPRTISWLEEVF